MPVRSTGLRSGPNEVRRRGGEQTQETQFQFSPQQQQFMEMIFGSPAVTNSWMGNNRPGTPGVGLGGINDIFNFGYQQPISPLQRQSTDAIGQYLNSNPMGQTQDILGQLAGGQGLANAEAAFRPIFERNLQQGLTTQAAQAPGRFNSALAQQGAGLTGQMNQDFMMFMQQAQQQQIQNQIQAALAQNTLGQGQFANMMGAGQFGLQQSQLMGQPGQMASQQQAAMQQMILQMLNQPTGQTTTTQQSFGLQDIAQMGSNVASAALLSSDVRLKHKLAQITDALDKVMSLNGSTWDWNAGGNSAGVIAQDVERVMPEAVVEMGGVKHVNYAGVIGLLVEAVKELAGKINV